VTRASTVALVLVLIACGPPRVGGSGSEESTNETGGSESGDGESGDGDGDGDPGDGDGDPGDGDGDTGDGDGDTGDGDGDTEPECGNGIVDPGENCDDANDQVGDPCSDDCQYPGLFCAGQLRECGDTLDNDDDNLIDLDDPDCLSPCDNNETSFSLQYPGGGSDGCKLDCYWDANSGQGDDQCNHNIVCDSLDPGGASGCAHDPDFLMCDDAQQSAQCLAVCPAMVPNGCDCFGCCQLGDQTIFLGIQQEGEGPCSAATPELCSSCTLHMGCFNPCDSEGCELCFLDSIEDLAPGCREPACPDGVQSCTSSYSCPPETSCKTGCCVPYELG
jgi:hypothetical protein